MHRRVPPTFFPRAVLRIGLFLSFLLLFYDLTFIIEKTGHEEKYKKKEPALHFKPQPVPHAAKSGRHSVVQYVLRTKMEMPPTFSRVPGISVHFCMVTETWQP
jgi:hypothetical protein